MTTTDVINLEQANTLFGLFLERQKRSPNHAAFRSYDIDSKSWVDTTWLELAVQIARWQAALKAESLQPGDRVAINLNNCVEWVCFDQAALGLGLVLVPLYPDDRPDNIAYILQDADVKVLLIQNSRQWKSLLPSITSAHSLQRVVIQNPHDISFSEPATSGESWLDNDPIVLQNTPSAPNELASIIYTSGTTGRPKGVMLSHQNMLSVASAALKGIEILNTDLFLSFLPLSHTLERTAGYYLPMMAGATVAYARSIPQLAEDMSQVRPTVMIAVPRIFERIHNKLQVQLADRSAIARRLFNATVSIGLHRFEKQQQRQSWHPKLLLWPLLNKLVATKVQLRFGGRIRILVSGGAALPKPVSELFSGLGFCILQGYGLTETSPIISVNYPNENIPTSVGQVIHNVNVKIGDNQELLVKGPGNMLGYWHNDAATADTINDNGWLRTGDQAHISETGHIYITGRIKDILVMSNGEKVPPGDIESALLMDNLFEQVLLLGEGQAFLAALLILNSDNWPALASSLALDANDSVSLNDKALHQHLVKRCRELLAHFPAYAKIRRVSVHLAPWTVENNLMTPTMKIKRPKVIAHHQNNIDQIYQ
jgi:long-chain acyl-CoA synthetase